MLIAYIYLRVNSNMGLIGNYHPSARPAHDLDGPNRSVVDLQPAQPISNLRARTVRVLALAFPPACVARVPTQPAAGPSAPVRARLGSVVNHPLSSLGFHCRPLCVRGSVGWPRHCDEASSSTGLKGDTLQTIYLSVTANIMMLRPRPRHRVLGFFLGPEITHSLTHCQHNQPNG